MDTTLDNYRYQGCYCCGNRVKVNKFGMRCALCERCQGMFRAWRGQPKPPAALQRKALPKSIQLKQKYIKDFCRKAIQELAPISEDVVAWGLAMYRSGYFTLAEIDESLIFESVGHSRSFERYLKSQTKTNERQLLWRLGQEGFMLRDYRNVNGTATRRAQGDWV